MKEMKKKYQIFLSSTFTDLIEERKVAIDAIMQLRQIPAGMELFGAMGEEQMSYIKEVIRESDYYLLIIGGKYGTIGPTGLSYTEEEYNYAVSLGLRVIAFVHENPEERPAKFYEQDSEKRIKLENFRERIIKDRLVSFWKDMDDLRLKILSSLSNVMNEYPAKGWIRETRQDDEAVLFPWLDEEQEKVAVTYDYNNPSQAVVRSKSSYVQLKVRDGRIEDWMVERCGEFIKLIEYNRRYFRQYESICLRRMWFNTVSPEIVVYIDFLYDISLDCNWNCEQIKEMFYNGQVLNDGQMYTALVRMQQAIFRSDHFDENHARYYEDMDEFYDTNFS